MDPARLRAVLERLSQGEIDIDAATQALRHLPFEDLGFAKVDHHRSLRTGFPEVVLGQFKTVEQIVGIARALIQGGHNVLVTRVEPDKAASITEIEPALVHHAASRTLSLEQQPIANLGRAPILVVTAGTSDQTVAEEAVITARLMGNEVERLYDAGVAGIHRLLHNRSLLARAGVLIVVAGMEGALASVIGGLVPRPVIAVPTSVGYGTSFGGIAALLGMLNSCAAGVTVVNIDNGFGAAYAASLINRREPIPWAGAADGPP